MNKLKEKIIVEISQNIIDNMDDIYPLIEDGKNIPILETMPSHYKDDEEIMLGIIKKTQIGSLLSYCSNRLKNDPVFWYEAVRLHDSNFSQAAIELQNNKEFVLKCIELPTFLIEDAPAHFLDDKDCAIAAIKRKGHHSLKVISERLKDDKEVALAAINYQPACYNYISDRLKNDKDIVLEVLRDEGEMKNIPESYRDNKEVMLIFFNMKHLNPQYLQNLQYVSDRLRNDPEVVISAIKTYGSNLQFAAKEFKNNKNLAILALENNGSLEFLSKSLRNDKEIVLRALQNSGSQLEFVGEAFKNDKDIVLLACQDNIDNIKYASLEIREEIGNSHPVKFIMSEKLYNEVNNKIPFAEEIKIRKKKI